MLDLIFYCTAYLGMETQKVYCGYPLLVLYRLILENSRARSRQMQRAWIIILWIDVSTDGVRVAAANLLTVEIEVLG